MTASSLSTARIFYEAALKRAANQNYQIALLDKSHIEDILDLSKKVRDSLSPDQQSFLLPKDKAYFEEHFSRGGQIIGIVTGGKLIGMSIITDPTPEHPETGMVDVVNPGPPETLTILSGVQIDPDYRGNDLMDAMVDFWLDYAAKQGRTHAMAEIAAENPKSWGNFVSAGLRIASIGRDPDDGTVLYNAHELVETIQQKKISGLFNFYADAEKISCGIFDFGLQKKLLEAGYVCVMCQTKFGVMTFVREENDKTPKAKSPQPQKKNHALTKE